MNHEITNEEFDVLDECVKALKALAHAHKQSGYQNVTDNLMFAVGNIADGMDAHLVNMVRDTAARERAFKVRKENAADAKRSTKNNLGAKAGR